MALEFAHGLIQVATGDTAGTVKTVSGLSFQPKALRFYAIAPSTAVDSASAANALRFSVGFATSTSDRRCVAKFSADAATSSNLGSIARNDCVVCQVDGSGAGESELDLNSITSDGFTLIVDDQFTASCTVFWEAWGGSDITVAACVDIAEPASTGDVDYTVTGFVDGATDQVVMFAGVQSVSALNTGEGQDSGMCVGFATGSGSAQCVVMGSADDASNTMDTEGYSQDGECLAMGLVGGNATPNARASLTQFGTDNFRLNWAERGLTNRRYIALAIKGGGWRAGALTINSTATTNTAAVSGLPFAPKGVCMIGRDAAESTADTVEDEDRMSLGTASSTSSRRSIGYWDEHGIGTSEINTAVEFDQVLVFPDGAGAVDSAYDISAFASDGFTVIVDDAPASGSATSWQGYLAFGDAASAPETGDLSVGAGCGATFLGVATARGLASAGVSSGAATAALAAAQDSVTAGVSAAVSAAALAAARDSLTAGVSVDEAAVGQTVKSASVTAGLSAGISSFALAHAADLLTAGIGAGVTTSALAAAVASVTAGIGVAEDNNGRPVALSELAADVDAAVVASALAAALGAVTAGVNAGESWAAQAQAFASASAAGEFGMEADGKNVLEAAASAGTTLAEQFLSAAAQVASVIPGAVLQDAVAGLAIAHGALVTGASLGAMFSAAERQEALAAAGFSVAHVFTAAAVAIGALSATVGAAELIAAVRNTSAALQAGASFGAAFSSVGGVAEIVPPAKATHVAAERDRTVQPGARVRTSTPPARTRTHTIH